MKSTAIRTTIFTALVAFSSTACMIGDEQSDEPLSYEAFVEKFVTTHVDDDGETSMMYDDDIKLASQEQLEQLYGAYHAAKSGESISEATVNLRVGGANDVWPAALRTNLTYCVSNKFGTKKAAVVAGMKDATGDWAAASRGSIAFVHVPAEDDACSRVNPRVVFNVVPATSPTAGLLARAFFPSEARKDRELLVFPGAFTSRVPFVGILRHELGHALGLRHETVRPEAAKFGGRCFEGNMFKKLTAFDDRSVMTTPGCMQDSFKNINLTLTSKDGEGIRKIYP